MRGCEVRQYPIMSQTSEAPEMLFHPPKEIHSHTQSGRKFLEKQKRHLFLALVELPRAGSWKRHQT